MGSKKIAKRLPFAGQPKHSRIRARSRTTGQFVSLEYAQKHRYAVRIERW
jgi:hypothetical protein